MGLMRMRKELKDLECKPPEGVICYPVNDSMVHLHAELEGPLDTPYAGGKFQVDINIPDRYRHEPLVFSGALSDGATKMSVYHKGIPPKH
ncbi:hypothetical protein BGZ83_009282 [Gryganskiella cystojenkinii]|nr:hypothetical protein BGZ83_009282 [Gryganskiella cystojenkinii]